MNAPLEPTEEQIAAAQLRIELDKKLDRETPEIVREIAAYRPTEHPPQLRNPLFSLRGATGRTKAEAEAEALARWRSDIRTATSMIAHDVDSLEVVEALTLLRATAAQYADIAQAVAHNELREVHPEASAHYRRAVQSSEPEVLNNLGNALRDLGRPDEALAAYQEALSIYRREHAEDHLQRSGADEPSASE